MTDVSLFWIAFAAYLVAMLALVTASVRRGGEWLARIGCGLMWVGLAAQTVSIVWRAFRIGSEPIQGFFPGLAKAFSSGPAWREVVYALVFVLAALAAVLVVVYRRRRAVWLLSAGIVLMLELILLDFLDFTRLPIDKVYDYLSIASWCAALALVALSPMLKSVALDGALAVATCLLVVFAAMHPKTSEVQLVPALQSYWLFIHVTLTSLGYAIFGISFVVAALFLVKSYDPADRGPEAMRTVWTALGVAFVLGAVAALLSSLALPFKTVAFDEYQLSAPNEPRFGFIQVFRYGAAMVGCGAFWAYVVFWAILAGTWLVQAIMERARPRSGFAPYLFVVSGFAMFAACLILGGVVSRQERTAGRLEKEYNALIGLIKERALEEGQALTAESLAAQVERLRGLSARARRILAQARWLPLTLETETPVRNEPLYRDLVDLYTEAGQKWELPIRYKDIKQIGRMRGEQADLLDAVGRRLSLPADRAELSRALDSLAKEYRDFQASAWLPREKEGSVAAFVGLAFLLAIPIGFVLHALARHARAALPDAKRLDGFSYIAIAVAYPVFTFGAIFAGAIWAHYAWGNWWSWDPKEVGSLVAWVLYTLYLHQRYREGISPRAAAVAGMLGFIAATLSLAGNAFLSGLHAYS